MIYLEQNIEKAAQYILENCTSKTICLYGEMGAGKTTLVKAIIRELGGTDDVSSPTFGIVNEYHHKDGSVLAYHFDFYRLNNENEAYDLGFEDYLDHETWSFIEWPEKIASILPQNACNIHIQVLNPTTRNILI